jgi:hypothetical protein
MRRNLLIHFERVRKKPVDQLSTINELHRFGHPKSMKMLRDNNESTMRKTDEARQQLIEHFKYAHIYHNHNGD